MAAINQNDTFYAGNKRILKFTIMNKDMDPVVALNLTGLTLRWELSKKNKDGTYSTTALLTKTLGAGIVVTDATNGKCEVTIAHADTAEKSGDYHQELQVIDTDSEPQVVATGTITLLKNISNS